MEGFKKQVYILLCFIKLGNEWDVRDRQCDKDNTFKRLFQMIFAQWINSQNNELQIKWDNISV